MERQMLNQVGRFIRDNLETYNATNPGVDKNPANRWGKMADRFNKKIDSIKITYNNGLELTPEEIEKIRVKLPSFINPVMSCGKVKAVMPSFAL